MSSTRQPCVAAAQRAHTSAIRHSRPARSPNTVRTTDPPHRPVPETCRVPARRPVRISGECQAQSAARHPHHASPRGPPPARIPARCTLTCATAALRPSGAPGSRCSPQPGEEQLSRTAPEEGPPNGSSRTVHTRPGTRSRGAPAPAAVPPVLPAPEPSKNNPSRPPLSPLTRCRPLPLHAAYAVHASHVHRGHEDATPHRYRTGPLPTGRSHVRVKTRHAAGAGGGGQRAGSALRLNAGECSRGSPLVPTAVRTSVPSGR